MKVINESLSLEKKHQSKFARKVSKIKEAKQPIVEDTRVHKRIERGIIYIGHLPHGFYEDEMRRYFSQFGDLKNVRVNRSRKTGQSKGYGFIEFEDVDVAKVAAETMNNYLMFKRRIVCDFVPIQRQHPRMFMGDWRDNNHPKIKARNDHIKHKNTDWTDEVHYTHCMKMLKRLRDRMSILKEMGIEHTFEPIDIPEEVQNRTKRAENDKIKNANKPKKEEIVETLKEIKNDDIVDDSDISDEEVFLDNEPDSDDEEDEECGKFVKLMRAKPALKTIKKKKAAVKPKKMNVDKMKMAAKSILEDFDNKKAAVKMVTKKAKSMKKK